MTDKLMDTFNRDRQLWDSCALSYEKSIVAGHPDVTAYEAFEEDFLDRLLLHLIRECNRRIYLFDIGCGSGRLHLRYGLKTATKESLSKEDANRLEYTRAIHHLSAFDPYLANGLSSIHGIDFSAEMIKLAKAKLMSAGLEILMGNKLTFEEGSAFDLAPLKDDPLPVLVTVCNSIGVMQGSQGAMELFQSLRRAVDKTGGIAIISAYRKEAVQTFGLGNYESTMNVSGQPFWLTPDTFASPDYLQIPLNYKRAYDTASNIVVDVFDREGNLVKKKHILTRDEESVRETVETGHIRTHSGYESNWYSFNQFEQWIDEYWPDGNTYHFAGREFDVLRAEPTQIAILDSGGLLKSFFERYCKQ